jgi:DNA-binding PadR family transcriptional regulator
VSEQHPSNPLALAVLALLFERPMHPYEMGVILKQRHKEDSIKLRYGSLYTVIELLQKRGFIAARETARDGRRPERTVYEITPAGRDELHDWMADLIAAPAKEYPQFEAA